VTLDEGSVYNIAISSSDIGVLDYTLTGANLDGGQLTGTVTDTVLNLTGGQAGFYMSNVNTTPRWDNLSISTIPEPATLGFVSIAAAMLFGLRRILG
ncbi:MAG: hypothetical protein U9P12_08200, partial [Verrucomicrobiota bacterium]|nr:hypothetical protein [Verrucomicrobiota bacterium]